MEVDPMNLPLTSVLLYRAAQALAPRAGAMQAGHTDDTDIAHVFSLGTIRDISETRSRKELLQHVSSAIYIDRCSGNISCCIGGKEQYDIGNLLGFPDPAQRDLTEYGLLPLFGSRCPGFLEKLAGCQTR